MTPLLAGLIAILGWIALAVEARSSISASLARGLDFAEALYLFLRYFTTLTNLASAVLMTFATWRAAGRRPLRASFPFAAMLVYLLVTCVTYEALLRRKWSPHGISFAADFIMHDVVPALTIVFWFALAPKVGLRLRHVLWVLVYPGVYLSATLIAGALGQGYPYFFLNVSQLGYDGVARVAAAFLGAFGALTLVLVGYARALAAGADRRAVG